MARLPSGYGSISKLKGNRTRPWMIRVRQKGQMNHETGTMNSEYKVIGYARTKKEAINLLHRYHQSPNFNEEMPTFKRIYYEMFDEFVDHLSKTSHNAYDAAYDAMEELHERPFEEIKMRELQNAVDNCGKNYPTIGKIKVLLNQMYKWAIKYDYVEKDYSKYLNIVKHKHKNPNKRTVHIFTKEQIDTLWEIVDTNEYYQVVLILIYSGVRITELLNLKKEDVNLEEQHFTVLESKTEAGVRRVPIADVIVPFFEYWMEKSDHENLITKHDGLDFKYSNFLNSYWKPIIEPLGWPQTPHHCRHTCVTMLTEAKVEPTYIKMIVGHQGAMSLTERVYTHISNHPLLEGKRQLIDEYEFICR